MAGGLSLPDPRGRQYGTALDHQSRVVERESVIQKSPHWRSPRALHARRSHHHRHQAHAVAQRRRHEAVTRRIGCGRSSSRRPWGLSRAGRCDFCCLMPFVLEFAHRETICSIADTRESWHWPAATDRARGGVGLRRGQSPSCFRSDYPSCRDASHRHSSFGANVSSVPANAFGQSNRRVIARLQRSCPGIRSCTETGFAQFDETGATPRSATHARSPSPARRA